MRKSYFLILSASWYTQVVIPNYTMAYDSNTKYSIKIDICYNFFPSLDYLP